ncbi:MFS general substrate transporter [Daedalea quercina L-15889]|uniref:MFS general substrate transporter n=1 Tax=Daedalea quercina L-15889 TaxID=1314783 RepID=A0A165N2T7_9APHY|nr:MFS general substrate transporter [Daedalea quercina L-15889]
MATVTENLPLQPTKELSPELEATVADLPSGPQVPLDGGLAAWLSVIGGWLVMFCSFGYVNSFGVFQAYYTVHHTGTSSDISWIGSLQLFLTFLVGLPSGKLLDAGHFRASLLFGSTLLVFSLFMLSLAHPGKYYQLILAQGVAMGLGSGFLLVPAQSVQAHHWRKRRSMAMGIVATGAGAGGLIYPILLNRLINGSVGFAWGVRASAFLTLGLLVVANCIMTTRPTNTPGQTASKFRTQIKVIFTDTAYLFIAVGYFLTFIGMYYPYFYIQLWTNAHGLSSTLAFYTVAILNASSIFGRTMLNAVAAEVGLFNLLVPVNAVLGVLVFAMFGVTSTAAVIVFCILYGFFTGAFLSLSPPALVGLANSPDEVGLRLGVSYFIASFAFLIGTPINGALLGPDYHWYRPTVFSAVLLLAGALTTSIARAVYARRKGTQRV